MPEDEFIIPDDNYHVPSYEKAKQYYGNEQEQLLSGIEAGLTEWDESGRSTKELKEKYSGKFRDGVEIGERLAVYEGRDFTFTEPEDMSESKFTFNS